MIVPTKTGIVRFVSRDAERVFLELIETIIAHTPAEVLPALRRIEAPVESGLHAAGYVAYEAAPAFDSALSTHAPAGYPLLQFGLYRQADTRPIEVRPPRDDAYTIGPWRPLLAKPAYHEALARIRDLIAAGDTYQVNYTFPLEASFHGEPEDWFDRLVEAQQADHCAYLDLGSHAILSASPELFFRLDGTRLQTRPMKGTRRRGRRLDEDREAAAGLRASEKDRAENVMIVDLLRNDMGRISEIGSVHVPDLFAVESYETVWQMVSAIESSTTAGIPEIFAALFPSGSVTGAPKVRAMQIIRDLEPHPRGVYCGAIGWWSPGRQAEFSVAIRTAVIDREIETARYSIGGGITWGSRSEDEYDECLAKAAVLTHRRPPFELLESLLFDGDYYLLSEHLDRLRDSAEYFGYTLDLPKAAATLFAYAQHLPPGPCKVRLLLSRNGQLRINHEPVQSSTSPRIGFARDPVDPNDVFLYHKTTHRAVYDRALASRPDCDDVLLWNTRGEITETCYANIILDLEGELLTPAWQSGLLAGTLRRRLIEEGTIREVALTREHAMRARHIYCINSVRKQRNIEWVE